MGIEPDGRNTIELFRKRLVETTRWCIRRGYVSDPVNSLRTSELRPSLLNDNDGYPWDTPDQRHSAVEALAAMRSELLYTERIGALFPATHEFAESHLSRFSGKLLVFDPDHSLSDGAAWVATAGFFDGDNVPPWDTWIYYVAGPDNAGKHPFNSYLLSWVPPEFMEPVANALEVNPEECILWATDLDRPFIYQLRDARLLF